LFHISGFLFYSLSREASLFQKKREERRLIGRISNLVDKSCKTRKLIKDLETKTKAVEAEASLIMEKKDKCIRSNNQGIQREVE
jgi:hypothetical protein